MLRIPDIKSEAFDPAREYAMHSRIQPADHVLRIGGGSRAEAGAIPVGATAEAPDDGASAQEERQMLEAIHRRNEVFDDAMVRSVLTDLHERGVEFETSLANLPARQAHEIDGMTETFLREQRESLRQQLTSDSQKRRFELGFEAFANETVARSGTVREEKTRLWQAEVTERQNRVFLGRALRLENLFDDLAQTLYRDMYLLNVDNLHADLPGKERSARLDQANREFCAAVLDKRLETDPARLRTMLGAPGVRRVLGDEAVNEYEKRAVAAARDDEMRERSRGWCDAGMEPADAERRAAGLYADTGERDAALNHYWERREKAGRKEVAKHLLAIEQAWRGALGGDVGDNPRLDALHRTDPELAAHMERALWKRRGNGGAAERPDYAFLLALTEDFDPRKAAEELRDRQLLLEVCDRLGGTESPVFAAYLRLFFGDSTPEDAERLDSLRLARDIAGAESGGDVSDDDMSRFLDLFFENVRVFMDRNGYKELERSEKVALAEKTMAAMGRARAVPEKEGFPANPK